MATFVPYQVDYSIKNTSKTFGFSKKRVSFKFGIANNQSIGQGLAGAECRGSEHEVIFIWSLNSGKRQILADGRDVHYSESGQNGWTTDQVFQHKFALRVPGFNSPMKCHIITAPASKDVVGSRPFDLRLNGVSYFAFSKIYQLGTPSMMVRPVHRTKGNRHGAYGHAYGMQGQSGNPDEDPYMTPEERKAIAAAKLESLKDYRNQTEKQAAEAAAAAQQGQGGSLGNKDEASLISFDDPAPPVSQVPPSRGQGNFVSSLTMDPTLQQPPHQTPSQPVQGAYNNYALPPQQTRPSMQQQQPRGQSSTPGMSQPFGSPAPPNVGAAGAITPYYNQSPSAAAAPVSQGGPQSFGAPSYGAQPMTSGAYNGMAPHRNTLTSPSNQSMASYGSAPSFAQPPKSQAQLQQQPPMSQPPNPYGQAPPSAQYGFAQPPPPQGYAQY